MQFTQGLHRAVQQQGSCLATVCGDRRHTFSELKDRVSRLAAGLVKQGFQKGDRIAILSLNSDRYLELYLAIAWMGGVVNPVNFRWSEAEIVYSLKDSQSRAIVVDDSFLEMGSKLQSAVDTLDKVLYADEMYAPSELVSIESLITHNEPIEDVGASGDDLFGIFYTGGTTGVSKGVMLTHNNLCSSAMALMSEGLFSEGVIGLHVAPMFHLADMMLTTGLILRGGRHVFLSSFKPSAVVELIEKEDITDLLLVPAMIQALVDDPSCQEADTSGIRNVMYGASPAAEALLDRAMQRFPSARFTQVYGMTETAAVMTVLGHEMHESENRKLGRIRSAGRSSVHMQIRVVDELDRELPRGEIGQIISRGPSLMRGYLNSPEKTDEALLGGWMHTGDMGYMDDDGYIFIVDRSKDMIISGGENVYSVEVENAVMSHPAVAACAVIGVPCEEKGEKVHAAVILKPGMSVELPELQAHCKSLIAGYKIPRSIDYLEALPMSGAGKILKTELRKPYWEKLDISVA